MAAANHLAENPAGAAAGQGGLIELDGQPLDALSSKERAQRLAYVPQSNVSAFAFSVEDLVLMGRTAYGGLLARPSARDRKVAAAAIDRMGITHLAARPVTMISGGERQLALIARALAQEARLIVLDEPTASLDFGNQGKVMREIRRLAGDGLGVLFTTHDPNHASRFADEALLIRGGRMVAIGASTMATRSCQDRRSLGSLDQARVQWPPDRAPAARNFNPVMAMAADTVIVESQEIVPVGVIAPDDMMTPAVLVDHLIARRSGPPPAVAWLLLREKSRLAQCLDAWKRGLQRSAVAVIRPSSC